MFEEICCEKCGAPLSMEEIADYKNVICDECKEDEVGKKAGG